MIHRTDSTVIVNTLCLIKFMLSLSFLWKNSIFQKKNIQNRTFKYILLYKLLSKLRKTSIISITEFFFPRCKEHFRIQLMAGSTTMFKTRWNVKLLTKMFLFCSKKQAMNLTIEQTVTALFKWWKLSKLPTWKEFKNF